MSKQLSCGLALALGLSLLAAGCGRRGSQKQAKSQTSERPAPARPSAAGPSASAAPIPANAGVGEADRLAPLGDAEAPDLSQRPGRTQFVGPRKAAQKTKAAAKPFAVTPPPAAKTAGGALASSIPPPPSFRPSAPDVVRLPLLDAMCCAATATYEPAQPNGFQRLIHKVPGLRKLNAPSAGDQGFVPPRPLRDIQFALPPDASPVLEKKRRMDLKASVDESGRVTRVELLFPRDEDLVTLASYAASRWNFAPAEWNGRPVPSEVLLHFNFDATSAPQTVDTTKLR